MNSRSASSGFVLVGVIMLVLALTILGLSLFSLSSYESQFLENSVDELQAFHVAGGGIERAKYVLGRKGRLEAVGIPAEWPPYIDSTLAVQVQSGLPVSSGPIEWGGEPVRVHVRATFHGRSQAMDASFSPIKGEDFYKRLFTVVDHVAVPQKGGDVGQSTIDRWPYESLTGEIWMNSPIVPSDTSWSPHVASAGARPIPAGRHVPLPPNLDEYLAEHASASPPPPPSGADYYLGSVGPDPTFYRSKTRDSSFPNFSKFINGNATFHVSGTVVWMFDHGFRIESKLKVEGSSSPYDCLVLVGKKCDEPGYPVGVWFFGGITSNVPVIIASDEEVRIEHVNGYTGENSVVPYLSVYAKLVWLLGPATSGYVMDLRHPQLDPDDVIDRLADLDVLPGESRNTFTFVPDTWSESKP